LWVGWRFWPSALSPKPKISSSMNHIGRNIVFFELNDFHKERLKFELHCIGIYIIPDNVEGDGPPIVEDLEVTFLKIKTYQLLSHPWVEFPHVQSTCNHIKEFLSYHVPSFLEKINGYVVMP
jgi:hypothetical protein